MTTVILGAHSQIAQEFKKLVPEAKELVRGQLNFVDQKADKYLICSGFLRGELLDKQSPEEVIESFMANYVKVVNYCNAVFSENLHARICVIGSESGYNGSYDMAYAGAKAALHMYIETKKLSSEQQLVCVSPGIIEDAGMTTRRKDIENLANIRKLHPKGRFIESIEVAKLAHFLLYEDRGFISNTVIRMHGGKH